MKRSASGAHCHRLVAQVAKEAAGELYEATMSNNVVRRLWQEQNPGANEAALLARFVARNWGRCIPFARATLATMLTKPIDEGTKETIMEALVLDATLMRGRAEGARVIAQETRH